MSILDTQSQTPPAPSLATLQALVAQAQQAAVSGDGPQTVDLLQQLADILCWGIPDITTGLASKDAWPELDRRHPPRDGATMAVVFVDLDGLKRLNDTQGHAAGDAYIRRAARALRQACRSHDRVATRAGGDEFVCFGPGVATDREVARFMARIEQALAAAHIPASVGGVRQRPGEPLDAAVQRADQVMYRIKQHHHENERGRTR